MAPQKIKLGQSFSKSKPGQNCHICNGDLREVSLYCNTCKNNVHLKCSALTIHSEMVLAVTSRQYMCEACLDKKRSKEEIAEIAKLLEEVREAEKETSGAPKRENMVKENEKEEQTGEIDQNLKDKLLEEVKETEKETPGAPTVESKTKNKEEQAHIDEETKMLAKQTNSEIEDLSLPIFPPSVSSSFSLPPPPSLHPPSSPFPSPKTKKNKQRNKRPFSSPFLSLGYFFLICFLFFFFPFHLVLISFPFFLFSHFRLFDREKKQGNQQKWRKLKILNWHI